MEMSSYIENESQRAHITLYPHTSCFVHIGKTPDLMSLMVRPESSEKSGYDLIWMDDELAEVYSIETSLPRHLHDLYFGLVAEPWGKEMRDYLWGPEDESDQNRPFFSQWPRSTCIEPTKLN